MEVENVHAEKIEGSDGKRVVSTFLGTPDCFYTTFSLATEHHMDRKDAGHLERNLVLTYRTPL